MIDKDYILDRLRNGEKIEVIGASLADMMNEACRAYEEEEAAKHAKAAEAAKETRKHELMNNLISIVQEWGKMEGMDEEVLIVSEEEAEELFKAMEATFALMKDVRKFASQIGNGASKATIRVTPRPATKDMDDDTILAEFAKIFG